MLCKEAKIAVVTLSWSLEMSYCYWEQFTYLKNVEGYGHSSNGTEVMEKKFSRGTVQFCITHTHTHTNTQQAKSTIVNSYKVLFTSTITLSVHKISKKCQVKWWSLYMYMYL